MVLNVLRIIICALSLVGVGFFVFPVSVGIVNVGNVSGFALCVWIFLVCCKPAHRFIREACMHFFITKAIYYTVNTVFVTLALLGITVSVFMVMGMNRKPPINSTAVVLGAQVLGSGNPSTILSGRIDAAERYLKENPKSKAVLSGGPGKNEPMSEAKCMYDNLIKRGISADRLFIEDRSTDTKENLQFSSEIIKKNNLGSNIAIITDGFHQERAKIIADQIGLKGEIGAYNADTALRYAPTYFVREWFGIPYQLLIKR